VLVLLSENAKIPVDDLTQPEELTLIHSATVLDYAGLDLAILHYNDSLKLWVFSTLLLGMVTPVHTSFLIDVSTASLAMLVLAILLGILEARWMRWPLEQGHRLALGALLLAALALALEYGYGI